MAKNKLAFAYNWTINACNSPYVGYSQKLRNEKTELRNGKYVTYYDCSSLMWFALKYGGYNMSILGGYPFTTWTMDEILTKLGFAKYPATTTKWLPGDILLVNTDAHQHTEMVYEVPTGMIGDGYGMGAHQPKAILEDEVRINPYLYGNYGWQYVYRDLNSAGVLLEWVKSEELLDDGDRENNAFIIWNHYVEKGWTAEAICGMLGNMEYVSSLNPSYYENGTSSITNGYGLCGWKPSTDYTMWATLRGYDVTDGKFQLEWIDTMMINFWNTTATANIEWMDFKNVTNLETAAQAWALNFDRQIEGGVAERIANSHKWFDYFKKGLNKFLPPSPHTSNFITHRSPLIYYMKRRY